MRLSLRPSLSAFSDPRAVADALRVLALVACALLLAACSRAQAFRTKPSRGIHLKARPTTI